MGEYRPGNRVNSCTPKEHFGASACGVKPSLSAFIVTNAHFTVHFYHRVLTYICEGGLWEYHCKKIIQADPHKSRILSDFAQTETGEAGGSCVHQPKRPLPYRKWEVQRYAVRADAP